MKRYGLKPKRYNYIDNHPPKGFINWWEADQYNNCSLKKAARQEHKKEASEQVCEHYEEFSGGKKDE